MSNRNPSPATRFKPGNSGKPHGTRDRLSMAFIAALSDSFDKHGAKALDKVRREDTSRYIRVIASLQPKQVQLHGPLDAMDDTQLAKAIDAITDMLRAKMEPDEPKEKRVLQ